jgi:hypothetical protein
MELNESVGLEKISFPGACVKFFGKNRGGIPQDLKGFNEELKALTTEDRAEFIQMFRNVGFEITTNIK